MPRFSRSMRLAVSGLLGAVTLLILVPFAASAGSTTTTLTKVVSIKQASLADHRADCADGTAASAHIVITQLQTSAAAPAAIQVQLTDGDTISVSQSKYVGKVAHYDAALSAGSLVIDATASVPANWTGQFNLSHYDCGGTTTSSSTTPTQPTS